MNISGGNSGGATLVPISNTKVKSSSAYGTALVTMWESRSLPVLLYSPIAQLVEQMTVNHLVASSSLARGAIFI